MALSHEMQVFTHDSIYAKDIDILNYNRKLNVYFSVPQDGTNEDTGLLLFVAGFGGQASSNVYKQMRNEFADKYNLVTIQCDYFGYEFMQSADRIISPDMDKKKLSEVLSLNDISNIYHNSQFDLNIFLEVASKYDLEVRVKADLRETEHNFNDMGFLQAIDNIVSVINVMNILFDNDCCFNSKKVIIYGHSHGAYLAYLCNAFAPKLFSLIIDNSAWVYPVYLYNSRAIYTKLGQMTLVTIFDYLAKEIIDDKEILNLPYLYSKFKNNCKIISYHGTTDNLISCQDKLKFCRKVKKCIYNEISKDQVENNIFKSTDHGLDADFKKMFDATIENYNISFEKSNFLDLENEITYRTSKYKYVIDYQNVVPKIHKY